MMSCRSLPSNMGTFISCQLDRWLSKNASTLLSSSGFRLISPASTKPNRLVRANGTNSHVTLIIFIKMVTPQNLHNPPMDIRCCGPVCLSSLRQGIGRQPASPPARCIAEHGQPPYHVPMMVIDLLVIKRGKGQGALHLIFTEPVLTFSQYSNPT